MTSQPRLGVDLPVLHYKFAQSVYGIGLFEQYIAQLKEAIKRDSPR